ncbi:MAG: haloacid dehalogenase type II [Hyphomicrobiales bacterium]|nr:haloacid dehalogenase type II [Hyphomicrobiales bacterium]
MDDIRALTFDTGGTILDWHSGISAAFAAAGARRGVERDWHAVTNTYRRRSLQAMLKQVNPDFNIDDVHRRELDAVAEEFDLGALTAGDRDGIWATWHRLDAWPGFVPALQRLRRKYVVASFTILTTSLIVDVARHNGFAWDAVVSCEMIGTYKTLPASYATCAKWLALDPAQIVMVACHNFDLLGAQAVGFRTAFVRRPDEWGPAGPPDPDPDPSLDLVVDDFAALADALGA